MSCLPALWLLSRVGVASAVVTTINGQGVLVWNGVRTFPIALSTPPLVTQRTPYGVNGLDAVVSAGVDLLRFNPVSTTWSNEDITHARELESAARERGVASLIYLSSLAHAQPGTALAQRLQQVVTALGGSPGMGVWKGADEPFIFGEPASSLAWAYHETRTLDPNHLSWLVQAPYGTASDLRPYSDVTDVEGVYKYPVHYGEPNPDLREVGAWTRLIASVTPDRAVMTTLQICFSGSADKDGSGAVVMPTRLQQRYMIYDAIINGARGLNFFGGSTPTCFQPSDRPLGWNWSYWYRVLKDLIIQIGPQSAVHPALLVPGTGLGLDTNDPQTQVLSRVVSPHDIWVFAARYGAGTRTVQISGLPPTATEAVRYAEPGSVPIRNGAFQDTFPQWGVHVYHIQ